MPRPAARRSSPASWASPRPSSRAATASRRQGTAIRRAIAAAWRDAGVTPADIGHVIAHGLSTIDDDRIEAQAIRDTLGDVPVTAPKSYLVISGPAAGVVGDGR